MAEDCGSAFEVTVSLPDASYDLYVDDVDLGSIVVGGGSGNVRFEPAPEGVGVGSRVEVFEPGSGPGAGSPVLSGVLAAP